MEKTGLKPYEPATETVQPPLTVRETKPREGWTGNLRPRMMASLGVFMLIILLDTLQFSFCHGRLTFGLVFEYQLVL